MERSWISFEATFQEEFVWRNLLVLEEVHVWEHMRVVSRAQVVELEARLHMYNLEAAQRSGLLRAHKFAMKWVVCSAPVPCQKLTANPNLPMLARDAAANDSTIREPTGPQCIATQLSPVQGRPSAHISKSSFPFYNPVMFPPQIVKHSNGNGIAEHYLGAASRPSTSTADQTLSMAADLAADQTAPQGPSFSAKPTYQVRSRSVLTTSCVWMRHRIPANLAAPHFRAIQTLPALCMTYCTHTCCAICWAMLCWRMVALFPSLSILHTTDLAGLPAAQQLYAHAGYKPSRIQTPDHLVIEGTLSA